MAGVPTLGSDAAGGGTLTLSVTALPMTAMLVIGTALAAGPPRPAAPRRPVVLALALGVLLLRFDLAHVAYDRAVDTHVSHLRKKIGRDQLKRPVIRCIRGTGYLLVPDWQPEHP